jgi:hypothetical protein
MPKINVYRTYEFIDKDPIIDRIKTMLSDEGLIGKGKNEMGFQRSGKPLNVERELELAAKYWERNEKRKANAKLLKAQNLKRSRNKALKENRAGA